jgi:hypothetical protein
LLRTLLLLAGTFALIVGLLAMHTLNGDAESHHQATTATIGGAMVADASSGHSAPTTEDCTYDCAEPAGMPAHDVLMVACVLALLVMLLVLVAPVTVGVWWPFRALLRGTPAVGSLAPRRPPSLLVLSISRT